ncbi:sensor histidine kinase [Tunicatimonas pelagia]|uniref:sensor histidine kinase n=1 Tax=Tunicatimonas pelagia TaxID=931531 RepID=UPI002666DE4A|nr:hybrid sensor histidine kinase/response regulator [Tunicatimonas pelagia]WKN40418.1 hybrid sensor histidine kinase/response regulator [Tunicatimonas pelagia]
MKEVNILLVEDNLTDQEIVKEMLESTQLIHYNLEICDRISQAIVCIARVKPDVILLDLSLPDSIGLQTLQRIQEHDLSIPIVILTGLDDPDVGLEAINKGAEDYLSKQEIHIDHLLAKTISFAIERHKLKRELFTAMNHLQQYNEKLKDYSYVIAHDLKSPLNNLRSLVDFYQQSADASIRRKVMGKIGVSVNRLDDMIRSFSNVFLAEKDLSKEPEIINIHRAISEVEEQLAELIRGTNTRIFTDFSKAETVSFVPVLFNSVLQNLVTNSIKYRDEHREPRISISTEDTDSYVIMHYEDNGIGIDLEQHQQRLFKLFNRFDTEKAKGTGVGLYMIKSILDASEGRIDIDSTVGEGTHFKLFLKKEKELVL